MACDRLKDTALKMRQEAVAVVEPRLRHAAPEDVAVLREEDVREGEGPAVGGKRADEGRHVEHQAIRTMGD